LNGLEVLSLEGCRLKDELQLFHHIELITSDRLCWTQLSASPLFILLDTFLGFAQKSSRQLFAAFQKSSVKIHKMCRPRGRNGLKYKNEKCVHSMSSKECKFKSIWREELKNSI
jgi:hypothetical protein